MLKQFLKYQSLGNDFVLFDWYKRPGAHIQNVMQEKNWRDFVIKICARHFGVGADGVLILKENQSHSFPEMMIFNSDGSQAEICLNGLRCVAHYLYSHYNLGESFKIMVGERIVDCHICHNGCDDHGACEKNDMVYITTNVGKAKLLDELAVNTINEGVYHGFNVNVGNPHFVIFNKTTNQWLMLHGMLIESNAAFPNKTNVEFVWQEDKLFKVLVYERGCGVTLACGSGAMAVTAVLFNRGMINKKEKNVLEMQGGKLLVWMDDDENIFLQAQASLVFTGTL